MRINTLVVIVVISLLLAMPVGGFVFGYTHAEVGNGPEILARIFIGIVFMFLTPMFFGRPPQNEGMAGEPFNAWPYIGVSAAAIFIALLIGVSLANLFLRKRLK